jgi:hypothetical protein
MQGWRVLAIETDAVSDWSEFTDGMPASVQAAHQTTAVVRISGQRGLSDTKALIERLTRWVNEHSAHRWSGIEIDYDCPSSQIANYAKFIAELRRALPKEMGLSLTALPTWLEARGLGELLSSADSSVLQVHSVLDPHHGLFDVRRAASWISAYAKISPRDFDVALPDYGSRVAWDAQGKLVSVLSEQSGVLTGPVQKEIEADPRDVAALLADLRNAHPKNLKGIVWFRLPVSGDQRIWSLTTLESVVQGRALEVQWSVSIERDTLNAYRINLSNLGNLDAQPPSALRIPNCQAADGMGYAVDHHSEILRFIRAERMLRAKESIAVGWTRCALTPEEVTIEN